MKYTIEEIKEAWKKTLPTMSDECMGVEIISTAEEGTWFEELFKDFKNNLINKE